MTFFRKNKLSLNITPYILKINNKTVSKLFYERGVVYLYFFLKLVVTINMNPGELSDFVEFKFDLDRLTISRIISPTNPSLTWKSYIY